MKMKNSKNKILLLATSLLVAFVMFIAGAVLLSAPALPAPQTVYASENGGGGLPVFYNSETRELRFTAESPSGFPFGGNTDFCAGSFSYNEYYDISFDGLANVVGNTVNVTALVPEWVDDYTFTEECVYFNFTITVFSDDGFYLLIDEQLADSILDVDGIDIVWIGPSFGFIYEGYDEAYFLIVSLCAPSGPSVFYDPETNILQFTVNSLIDFPFGNDAFVMYVGVDYNDGYCYTDGTVEFISIDVVGNTMTVTMPVMEVDGDLEATCTRFWCEILIQSGDELYVFWNDEFVLDMYSWGGWSTPLNKSNIGVEWNGASRINNWIVFLGKPYVLDICEDVYTVTYLNNDGGTITISTLDYGTTISTSDVAAPTVPGQTFAGWQVVSGDPVGAAITQDTVLRATYSSSKYTVTFQNKDGGTITTTTLNYGTIISAGSVTPPAVTGYTFDSWQLVSGNPIGAAITQNTVLKAVYSINPCTLTFLDKDGGLITANTLEYGSIIMIGSIFGPSVDHHVFSHWMVLSGDDIGTAITQDTVVKAVYTVNRYTIIFWNEDGSFIDTVTLEYGTIIRADAVTAPNITGCTFDYWETVSGDAVGELITRETVLRAVYKVNKHIVTFQDKDGDTLAIITLNYGTPISTSSVTAPYVTGWTFSGWLLIAGDAIETAITQDTILRATYAVNRHTVIFQNMYGGTITTVTLDYGTIITTDSVTAPIVAGYTFIGWQLVSGDPIGAPITQNTVLIAVYDSILQYTVSFLDYFGGTLDTVALDYGAIISTNSVTAPTVTGHTFAAWQLVSGDPIGTAITQNTVLKATYTINTYTLTVLGHDDVVLNTIDFQYGDVHYYDLIDYDLYYGISLPEIANMYFAGWEFEQGDNYNSIIRESRTVKVLYLPIAFTVSYHSSVSGLIEEVTLIKGETVSLIDPRYEAGYTFSHWQLILGDPAGAAITQDTEFMAVYVRTTFTVTYLTDKDAVMSVATLYEGELISAHEDWELDYDNHLFIGWTVITGDDVGSPITQDTVLRAVYYYGETFAVTLLGIDGIVLAVYKYPAGTVHYSYEFPVVEGYTLVDQEVISGDAFGTPITQDTVVQAIYSRITPTVMFRGKDGDILSNVTLDYGEIVEAITAPVVEGYTFSYWELLYGNDIGTAITQDTVFRAVYLANLITYTVEVYKQQNATSSKIYIATHTYSVGYGSRFTVELWFADSVYHNDYELRHYTGSAPYPLVGGEEFTVYLKEFDNTVTVKLWLPLGVTSVNFSVLLNEAFDYSKLDSLVNNFMGAGNGEITSITRSDGKELNALFKADTVVNVHVSVRISVTYYSLERVYYTKLNPLVPFMWVMPGGVEYKYSDFIVKRTDYYWTGVGPEPAAPDFNSLIPAGLYGAKKYASVPGFKLLGWDNGRADLLPGLGYTHYVALYEIPQIKVEYYGSNGKYVETRYIDPYFVPVTEINFDWLEAFEKYYQDVLIKLDLFEFADDAQARLKAKELVKYVSDAYKQDLFEVYFMVAQPTVNIEGAFGIFKAAAAAPISSTFKYLCGTSTTDDYVYYADLTNVYVTGIKYDIRVTFDTPYDNAINTIGGALNSIGAFLKGGLGLINNLILGALAIGGVVLVILALIKRSKA